ncbi:MAG: hypothetical protein JO240_15970 [Solirubrobacterales bacterium]|nr:hypothetical protein [Solirubrobacterales bacterium]
MGFVGRSWRDRSAGALKTGARNGILCLGCSWGPDRRALRARPDEPHLDGARGVPRRSAEGRPLAPGCGARNRRGPSRAHRRDRRSAGRRPGGLSETVGSA